MDKAFGVARRRALRAGVVAGVAGLAVAALALPGASTPVTTTHKVWVCKYVGKPGVDERLKHGKNPISVDGDSTAGTWFNDAQGRSFVLGVDDGGPTPTASECPDESSHETTTSYTTTSTDTHVHKVWVCKYVGEPGVDERLKHGKNPISVDGDSTGRHVVQRRAGTFVRSRCR